MSRTSLTQQLVDLRRRYTGETSSQVVPAVRAVTETLDVERRDLLVNLLRGNPVAVPVDLRRALFPEAGAAQRELEAGLALAAANAGGPLALRPPVSVARPAHAIRSVELEKAPHHTLTLHLHEHALGPLLLGLLPSAQDGELSGLAGLRHRQHPRCVELFLLGADAKVVLAGVSARTWHAGVVFVEEWLALRGITPQWLWQQSPERLTSAERSHVDSGERVAGPADLGSAVLRRSPLWNSASWLTQWAAQDLWLVEWPAGPAQREIVDALLHPLFGLPGSFRHEETGPDSGSLVSQESAGRLMVRTVNQPAATPEVPAHEWPDDFFRPWRRWSELTEQAR
ncbi:hypothetical protein [Streptoalloteichus hindustanus]|uniref:Uncharacterized protein n=1 Tax=Streptoalloteichus hindustanus TaxID=2017 RepID=A0A1M4YWM4_STRHI|nr:hypothetical protein [Streptoalloteichus hindustanus]SHF10125.1 hypothetical protein SAMN05444320_102513 [Streptoalloteichus hindustanus]